eukprot:CAMPEP_0174966844 /NCGR_PEP_ID=MMETSP0004_2-20121128/7254_1 /TAXON_ID=420556 /ORGANISM="Ochromonas sp., Strain CCMP1393" /LENGTH=197 /DNA_ID=CAMNT_0016215911 /DNA_START=77 /DNA_END=670 /DNA_ORIENTATION=-
MFRAIVLLASFFAVVAFAPSGRVATSSALSMNFKNAMGAQPPLGFWDPLGLLKDAKQERFDRLRTVELKHGRISMLAILGHMVTTAGVRLPGDIATNLPFASMKTGLAAFDTIPAGGTFQLFLFIGVLELGFNSYKEELEEKCEKQYSDYCVDRRKAVELNNGRAAQMGILGLMVHEKLDNNPYILNSLLGSPVPFN